MPVISKNARICEVCGSPIDTTSAGDLGCIACLIGTGLDTEAEQTDTSFASAPDQLGAYTIEHHPDGSACSALRAWLLWQLFARQLSEFGFHPAFDSLLLDTCLFVPEAHKQFCHSLIQRLVSRLPFRLWFEGHAAINLR